MEFNGLRKHTSKSHAETGIEWNFLTIPEDLPNLKNKYYMAGHSVFVPIGDQIYVGEVRTTYRPGSMRHVYSTDDFYSLGNPNTNNNYVNVVKSGSTCGNCS